jgi:hypothetical protein
LRFRVDLVHFFMFVFINHSFITHSCDGRRKKPIEFSSKTTRFARDFSKEDAVFHWRKKNDNQRNLLSDEYNIK